MTHIHMQKLTHTRTLYKYVENAYTFLVSAERKLMILLMKEMTRDNFGHACKSTRKFKTSVMAPSFVHLLTLIHSNQLTCSPTYQPVCSPAWPIGINIYECVLAHLILAKGTHAHDL